MSRTGTYPARAPIILSEIIALSFFKGPRLASVIASHIAIGNTDVECGWIFMGLVHAKKKGFIKVLNPEKSLLHIPAQTCNGCHHSVVDENLNIINKFLHINGKVDVY